MKLSLLIPLGSALCIGACAPTAVVGPPPPPPGPGVAVAAPGVVVAVEDQPYYIHGPFYLEHGRRFVWVAGHYVRRHSHRVWVHGRYAYRA